MDIYTDYVNWKFENHEFIQALVKTRSKTISRFSSVIVVVDYLYEQYTKRGSLSSDEEVFFSVGFDYIHDNFYTIKTLFEYNFHKDYTAMEAYAKTINLLLYTQEFQSELANHGLEKDLKKLEEFETQITTYLDKKENVPDAFFPMLDDIVNPIFERNNLELNPIESIYYEIAIEYGIYKNNETDIFASVFQLQKEKTSSGH